MRQGNELSIFFSRTPKNSRNDEDFSFEPIDGIDSGTEIWIMQAFFGCALTRIVIRRICK